MGLRSSPGVFVIAYCAIYVLLLAFHVPLFLYYPEPRAFSWSWRPLTDSGPAMAWYGLIAVALPGAGLLALVVPDNAFAGAVRKYSWLALPAAMVACAVLMKDFFLR